MNITTATNKKKVRQQASVTLTNKNLELLELAYHMIIMNKLRYDGILGTDLLISARC